jgi:uncharacterized membrane-anchored protein
MNISGLRQRRQKRRDRLREHDKSGSVDTPAFLQALYYVFGLAVLALGFGVIGLIGYSNDHRAFHLAVSCVAIAGGVFLIVIAISGLFHRRKYQKSFKLDGQASDG